jgi:hypothetical protein
VKVDGFVEGIDVNGGDGCSIILCNRGSIEPQFFLKLLGSAQGLTEAVRVNTHVIQFEAGIHVFTEQLPGVITIRLGKCGGTELALDDQVNSRLVELANYSSWYPQFFVMGHPLEIKLQVSLPEGWVAICSGKKLEQRVEYGRSITRWSSPRDTDILIAASPNYKEKSTRLSDVAIEIYYTQMRDTFVESEMRQIADVMKLFTDRLGETTIPAGTIKHVYSPKRKGQGRAGIAGRA